MSAQTPSHPSTPDPKPPRKDPYRRVLTIFTALLVIGLVAAALWPVPGPGPDRGGQTVSAPPASTSPPADPPPKTSPPPVAKEEPKGAEPKPLPERPAGEPSQLVEHGSRSCPMIALTYDAGSGADGAAAILDTLKKHGLTSTFFLTGKWVERYPDLAKRIAAEGHEIANHTYSHPDLTKLPADEVIKQIKEGEAAIRKVTGKETKPLFREPYGAFNDQERRLVRQAGYSYSVYWDVDTLDWQFPPVETLVKRITEKTKNGSVVLMHLNVPDTAVASDQAIPILREKGYKLVTVTELLQCKQ